jgi:hypothetical protein
MFHYKKILLECIIKQVNVNESLEIKVKWNQPSAGRSQMSRKTGARNLYWL